MNVSSDRDISMAFEKMAVIPTIIHGGINNSHLHFEKRLFQAVDHLKEFSHNCPDIDSSFYFIKKSRGSNVTKESLKEIITYL